MRYYLHQERDLTWENALQVARRWEAAHDAVGDSSDEDVGKTNSRKKKEVDGNITLATLSEEVKKNAKDIEEIKLNQAEFNASFAAMTISMATRHDKTEAKLDLLLQDMHQRQLNNQYGDDEDEQYGY